jgi:hypothetical protein
LPKDIQQKLEKTFDCCEAIDKKDMSTLRKHWFSNRHFEKAVGEERPDTQPTFACPAFLSMHSLCKNAKYVPSHTALCPAFLSFSFLGSYYGNFLGRGDTTLLVAIAASAKGSWQSRRHVWSQRWK